jgi:uncharacterized protein (DUF952 family)
MILHITTHKEWDKAQKNGEYTSPSLVSDGFIHCSTINQTADTATIFFQGQLDLILLCIDEDKLTSECRYEDPAGGGGERHDPLVDKLFPHVYGPINLAAVFKVVDFPPNEQGHFELPKGLIS